MNKREFIRVLGLAGLGVAMKGVTPTVHSIFTTKRERKRKQWAWLTTDTQPSTGEWESRFAAIREAGVDAILPEIYNSRRAFYGSKHLPVAEPWLEKILPLAKAEGMEVHAWMWSMPCNVEEVIKQHPEWYVVNRLGESAAVKPAYVNYYRFLCPSRPEVWEFVQETVTELSQYDELDGIHLDYIRYPDVILPVALQPRYGLKQDREYPQFDYCYCDVCRRDFQKETGTDPLKLDDPGTNKAWSKFRYDRITHIVNDILLPVGHEHKKLVTAAVFPNWENVRQQWFAWKLDAALPMLYARFYNEGIDWVEEQTRREVELLSDSVPLYSGLSVTQLDPEDLSKAVKASYKGGASGVSLFSAQAMTAGQWQSFSKAIKS